ncbi:MAG: hypothetical protein ACLP3C_36050 [Mycobacterium sp.]
MVDFDEPDQVNAQGIFVFVAMLAIDTFLANFDGRGRDSGC